MRAPGRTLQSRIVWTTVLVSAVAMSAMIGTVLLVLQGLTTKNIDRRLTDQASAVATTILTTPDGSVTAPETPVDSIDDTTWIYDAQGRLVEGPRTGARVTQVVESLSEVERRTRVEQMERVFLAEPVRIDGTTKAVVVVEASLEPYETTRNLVLVGLVGLGLVVTAGSAAVAAWTVRRTLAPVESMATRAEDWSEHDLDSRFDTPITDDELARLGRTLNVLLDRVAGALRNEQQLTAELAHELRTPLTAIRGEAELARMAGLPRDADERLERVMTLVDRMSTTIASLLAIARGEQRADAHTGTTELIEAAADHAPTRDGVTIVTDVLRHEVSAPLDLATRALQPIVENAVRHARTQVTFAVAQTDRVVAIAVSDDGPGIDRPDVDALFESGTRGPDSSGAGLGLALARRVATTLGGDVTVTSTSEPTTFTLTLPRF
ncbi:HAMP domain-containing histidine kinase [Aeromicrobium fastidiosum]|uniref:sensor histidine kinase n=1 Tax=Aeromicrobium fastidiosum TaxID=52699 RepID=UPI00202337EB|nr:HAMP domain-containing sensor histidine kinase [Aeromicrobium fastidiosum]MCL8251727.1 HAMP domain-containing histidine kinase [Aeromicrobium fastidiosum]